jgi:hypothetical protein
VVVLVAVADRNSSDELTLGGRLLRGRDPSKSACIISARCFGPTHNTASNIEWRKLASACLAVIAFCVFYDPVRSDFYPAAFISV